MRWAIIEIAIDFDQEAQEFVLEWPELNIFLGAETREELWDDFVQDFFWLWEEYGKSEAQDLSQDAIELKQCLQNLVQEECMHCSKEQESMLEFVEPHPIGGTSYVRISKEQAIAWQKRQWPQATDEEALEDFKTIHGAYERCGRGIKS